MFPSTNPYAKIPAILNPISGIIIFGPSGTCNESRNPITDNMTIGYHKKRFWAIAIMAIRSMRCHGKGVKKKYTAPIGRKASNSAYDW